MNKKMVILACIFGLLSVVFGAFGAHGLRSIISADSLQSFETGVRYQMYHALLLLIVGANTYLSEKIKISIFYLILFGTILFSGSIYGLATNEMTSFDFRSIAFITPLGGLLLILSWIVLLIGFIRKNNIK
ncbi:MAG: DUF423 domain-containing protein [Bacteroidia bacterium]|nr:DUF423 domain-containing protein [Bacteroidia bacterium]